MTKDAIQKAFVLCDSAFHRYVKEAHETHRQLSKLSTPVTLQQRIAVMEQRLRENDAHATYADARNTLFEVLVRGVATAATEESAK